MSKNIHERVTAIVTIDLTTPAMGYPHEVEDRQANLTNGRCAGQIKRAIEGYFQWASAEVKVQKAHVWEDE